MARVARSTGAATCFDSAEKWAIIWRDIGHYHAARARALQQVISHRLELIEITAASEYREFRVPSAELDALGVTSLGLHPPLTGRSIKPRLTTCLNDLQPTVVFVPGWSMPEALIAIEWCSRNRIPCVLMSESTRDDQARYRLKEAWKRRIVAAANAAVVGGTPHAAYAEKLGIASDKIFKGYDVVDNTYFQERSASAKARSRERQGLRPFSGKYFFCCARLVEKKNIERLVEAFDIYRSAATGERWHLVIAGPGPLEGDIRRAISERGLDGLCWILGARTYDEIADLYSSAEVFVLPSTTEQWGLVVNEAMAAGLPVAVSNRCGCTTDLVQDGVNGLTFDPFDVRSISSALIRISSAECDRSAMGQASSKIIREWGGDRFAAACKAAAKVALASPRPTSSLLDRLIFRVATWK